MPPPRPSAADRAADAYTLAFAVLLIAGARLGDIFGRRRLFLVGSAGFTLFSPLAPRRRTRVLIVFRVLQGAFGALMIPQGFGLLKQVFLTTPGSTRRPGCSVRRRGAMLAAPILAGALVGANLWGRVASGLPHQRPDRRAHTAACVPFAAPRRQHPNIKLDVGGVWLVGLALIAIIYPLIQGRSRRLACVDLRAARGRRGPAPRVPAP